MTNLPWSAELAGRLDELTIDSALLADNPNPTDEEIRAGLSGNLCRCTGYQGILAAIRAVAEASS